MAQADASVDLARRVPAVARRQETMLSLTWRYFRKHRLAIAGLCALGLLVLGAVTIPVVTQYDPGTTHIVDKYLPPSLDHPMGTDGLGRDMFIRSMDGGRISLLIGLLAMFLSIGVGTFVGAIAGYYGGLVDNVLMRTADVMLTLPTLFVAILLTQLLRAGVVPFLSAGIVPIILVVAFTSWMPVARLVRASFLSFKEKEFVDAARSAGAGNGRIMLRHILPNAISPAIVLAARDVGGMVVLQATFSFIDLGGHSPWSELLATARNWIVGPGGNPLVYWWTYLPTVLVLILFSVGWNFTGDSLNEWLNPRKQL